MGTKNLPPHEAADLGGADPTTRSGVYDTLADKVGLIPNVRVRDNAVQALVCLACAFAGAAAAAVLFPADLTALLSGILLGLVGGLLASGGVLMIVGLARR